MLYLQITRSVSAKLQSVSANLIVFQRESTAIKPSQGHFARMDQTLIKFNAAMQYTHSGVSEWVVVLRGPTSYQYTKFTDCRDERLDHQKM
jgi:hypothetical protein